MSDVARTLNNVGRGLAPRSRGCTQRTGRRAPTYNDALACRVGRRRIHNVFFRQPGQLKDSQ